MVVSQRLGYWRIEAVRKIIRAFHGRPIIAWSISAAHGCAYRKSNPGILMVQSAQDRTTENASGCLGGA